MNTKNPLFEDVDKFITTLDQENSCKFIPCPSPPVMVRSPGNNRDLFITSETPSPKKLPTRDNFSQLNFARTLTRPLNEYVYILLNHIGMGLQRKLILLRISGQSGCLVTIMCRN